MCNEIAACDDDRQVKEDATVCVILAVTAVDVFLNTYFRVIASEDSAAAEIIVADLQARKSLEHKLRTWPAKVLGGQIDKSCGPGREFDELRRLRNRLVHFTSAHETVEVDDIRIKGLADTSDYDSLDVDSAVGAVETAEAVVREIFRLKGHTAKEIPHVLHSWIGREPSPSSEN